MAPLHPFLKRPSVEVPAAPSPAPSMLKADPPPASQDWAFIATLGTGFGVIAILLSVAFTSTRLPPIAAPMVVAVEAPRAAVTIADMAPTASDVREDVARIGDMVVFAPPAHAPAPRAPVAAAPAQPPAAPAPAAPHEPSAFADQVVLYRPPAAAAPAPASKPPAVANAYHVVSIAGADLALIAMDIDGQTMVSPFRVGQALPDGRTITAIDVQGHRVVTNSGALGAP